MEFFNSVQSMECVEEGFLIKWANQPKIKASQEVRKNHTPETCLARTDGDIISGHNFLQLVTVMGSRLLVGLNPFPSHAHAGHQLLQQEVTRHKAMVCWAIKYANYVTEKVSYFISIGCCCCCCCCQWPFRAT